MTLLGRLFVGVDETSAARRNETSLLLGSLWPASGVPSGLSKRVFPEIRAYEKVVKINGGVPCAKDGRASKADGRYNFRLGC